MANFIDTYNTAKRFIFRDIWKTETSSLSTNKRGLYNVLRVGFITVKGFVEDKCSVRASALTYFTLLSVVPIVALAFAIAKGFGLESMVENLIRDSFAANPDTANYLISFSSSMLENTKGGVIAGIGVVMLMYSVFKLLDNIEEAFNFMWNVKNSRTLLRKVTDYITIMIFTPIMLIIASSATFMLKTNAGEYLTDYLSPLLTFLVNAVPFVLMGITFTIVYLIMPNTKVNVKSATIAGIVTGVIFQIWQWIFVTFQVGVSQYGAVYGSFAALPLFLLWLQTSWIIVLLGCELSYSVQNVNFYTTERSVGNISPRLQKRLAMLIMTKIVKNFAEGKPARDAVSWSMELKISQRMYLFISQRLQEVGLLAEIKNENEKSGSPTYIPAVDISQVSVSTICDKLDTLGEDDDFPLVVTDELNHIDELCSQAEDQLRESLSKVMLKTL